MCTSLCHCSGRTWDEEAGQVACKRERLALEERQLAIVGLDADVVKACMHRPMRAATASPLMHSPPHPQLLVVELRTQH